MKALSYNNFFINFANKAKLEIIIALRECPLTVSEIIKKVNKEQSAVSHNLKKLKSCYIINVKKKGKSRLYSLNENTVIPMLKFVEKHIKKNCCEGCKKCS